MALKLLSGATKLSRNRLQNVRFSVDETSRNMKNKYSTRDEDSQDSVFSTGVLSYTSHDSGAPSPEGVGLQAASDRYIFNEQRIKLLQSINQVVKHRADLENDRETLINLLDECKNKLKRRIDDCHFEKKENSKNLKHSNQRLDKEKQTLTREIEHLKRHLGKEEAHHARHAKNDSETAPGLMKSSEFSSCSIASLPALVSKNVARNAPSKISDNKLAAARLMRDIAELRQRVAQIDAKLSNELKRKRQAENDIVRLRRELSISKSNLASLRLPPPLLRNQCSRFS